jgi:nucleoside-diphosphate-sugar epimerase
MKVLIVGGAGYVGSPLVYRMWRDGHDITVLDLMLFGSESLVPLLGQTRFTLVAGDLRDEALLDEIVPGHDAVVLLGAIVGEAASNRDTDETLSTNLRGAEAVSDAARRHAVPRFVFVSTCSNYGVSNPDGLVREDAPLMPISPYSKSKVLAEKSILGAADSEFHPTVLRLSTAFGISPRMRFDLLVSDFTLAAFRDGEIAIYGEQFWRPFIHVSDIATAISSVLEADLGAVSGEVFNVGTNDNNTQKLTLGQAVQTVLPDTKLTLVERTEDPRSYRVDFTKIENALGFEVQWTIEDGIRELVAALQSGVFPDPTAPKYVN